MDAATRELVRQRAGKRCEYCHFPDFALDLPFHIEHVVASVHRVDDRVANLAWACPRCNLKKGPNLTTIDPETTPCGRGTVRLLDMNNETRLAHRQRLIENGEFHAE